MIRRFVDHFMDNEPLVRAKLEEDHPYSYEDIVALVIENVSDGEYNDPDPTRIHTINDGDYQGTLVFVIAANGYQPYTYWYTKVSYGSCGGCDTLQGIRDDGPWDGPPTPDQVNDYWTLALHVAQGLKEME